MSTAQLMFVHTRYNLVETARVPIAVIGSLVFPTLAFCLFVLPQSYVTEDPQMATASVASMVVFAFMSAGLFSIGIDLAEQRAKPWVPFIRTLPAKPSVRIGGLLLATVAIAVLAMVPLLVVGALFTAAAPTAGQLVAAMALAILTSAPSMLIGVIIGTLSGPKAAIAVTQVAMFLLAFGGGLFLPPQMFAPWLDSASSFLPVRQAREIVVGTATGGAVPWWAVLGIIAWTLVLGALAVWLYRRDEGRRYR
ncbi:ABC transporter permease [Demequina sp.]|uniref:ABC transporter permease n=1 Tax=Demequina sp. TaxID=2050685 RepID=UPI003A86DBD8